MALTSMSFISKDYLLFLRVPRIGQHEMSVAMEEPLRRHGEAARRVETCDNVAEL